MSDSLIWIFILFVFLIIIGLYVSEYTPLDLNEKDKILSLNISDIEHFSPSVSNGNSISEGASRYYSWGLPDNNVYNLNKCDHKCDHKCLPECPHKCLPSNITINNCTAPPPDINLNHVCSKCDITLNKDIDKYILKNSVPPCPDMSEYVTKNMINSSPDLNDYILKSEIKPCEKVDLKNYILKSQIPPCPTCPICPECPICPICPPKEECKKIYQYDIIEHPKINKYISKDDVNKNYVKLDDVKKKYVKIDDIKNNYIKKSDIFNNDEVKKYLKLNCYHKPHHITDNDDKPIHYNPHKDNNYNNIFSEDYSSELLNNKITGVYAGDSLFSTV
jgi:hypothetical protein